MVGKEKGTREVFRGPPTRPLTCRPSPAVGCWSGHSESPRLPRASVEFPLLQSLSQVDTAVTLLRLLIHLLWPPTASPERDTGAGGEGAQEKQPQSPLGPAQSLGCPLGSLTASQQDMEYLPRTGKSPAQLPGTRMGLGPAMPTVFRPNVLELCVVPGKSSAGGVLCAQGSCPASPHAPAHSVGCLQRETADNAGTVPPWRRKSTPCCISSISEGVGKKKTNEFSKPICF